MNDSEKPFKTKVNGEEVYLATTTESEKRAYSLLPSEGFEDKRSILQPPEIIHKEDKEDEYLPNEDVEWVITVTFKNDSVISVEEVEMIFNTKWRKKYGGLSLYGLDMDSHKWTFALGSDGPEKLKELKISWDYYDAFEKKKEKLKNYEKRVAAVEKAFLKYNVDTISCSLSPEKAESRHKLLAKIYAENDAEAILILKANPDSLFEGKRIWDTMLCLGLKWGDMDLFHWENNSDAGDQSYFSVWTSTNPGYFLPEEIAEGNFYTEDLIFGFSIPRTCKPAEVFKSMIKAVEYAQNRLDGEVIDINAVKPDFDSMISEISELEKYLKESGFEPGTENSLRLF